MLNIKIAEKEFKLPENWDEVNVRQYLDVAIKAKDSGYSEIEKFMYFISILSDNPIEMRQMLEQIEIEEFETLKKEFQWVLTEPEIKDGKSKFFELNGKKYTMKSNYEKLTVGESITIETLLRDKSVDMDPVEIAFCVLFREMNEDGTIKTFNSDNLSIVKTELASKIKITDVYKVICFFLTTGKKSSSKNLKDFSLEENKKKKQKTSSLLKISKVK